MSDIKSLINKQYLQREQSPDNTGIKINLYRGYEANGVARAIQGDEYLYKNAHIESVMVADSFLMTHLKRSSTILTSPAEQSLFLDMMISLVAEVAVEMKRSFQQPDAPYLIADLPDGAADTVDNAVRSSERMLEAGGDVIKLEIKSENAMEILEALTARDIPVMAHLGYTPQGGDRNRVGKSTNEILDLFSMARRVRDFGACALVIEKVSEVANELLCQPNDKGLLVYSIFSGRARYGGQSLNVWDSVFIPPFQAKFFPPTGTFSTDLYPSIYTPQLIQDQMAKLVKLTIDGSFPLSPKSQLSQEAVDGLRSVNPWCETSQLTRRSA